MVDKKQAKLDYKLSNRPMGIYQIRNTQNDKVWVNHSLNLPGSFNGDRTKLNGGFHPARNLLADWKLFGEDSFVFEILEEVFPRTDPNYDYKADLIFLEDLWIEQLQPFADKGYNEPKKSTEERLQMIRENRKL
jgi:hypothetical protein